MSVLDDLGKFFGSLGFGNVKSAAPPQIPGTVPSYGVTGATYPAGTPMAGTSGMPQGGFPQGDIPQSLGSSINPTGGASPLLSTGSNFLDALNKEHGSQYYQAGSMYPDGTHANEPASTPLPSFQDALAQARSLMQQSGYSPGYVDVKSISYDPLRKDANARASQNDAKLKAMYAQLQDSVRKGDAAATKANYTTAQNDVKAASKGAVDQITAASAAADAHNSDVLKALGLGDAQIRQIQQGRDNASATAQNVADAVARGQAAQQAVSQNQQAASNYNTGMAGAYGLQGAETRDALTKQLATLQAQYDMQEQQARNAAVDRNTQLGAQSQNALFGLANSILSNDWNTQKYNDSQAQAQYQALLQQQQAQQQAAQQQAGQQQALNFLQQIQAGNGGKLASSDVAPFLKYLIQ